LEKNIITFYENKYIFTPKTFNNLSAIRVDSTYSKVNNTKRFQNDIVKAQQTQCVLDFYQSRRSMTLNV